MKRQSWSGDVTVVGGGLAGVCAAIAAAREGARVALVNNRPVLGGNSSSEVRVWVVGATAHGLQRFARETGIIGELLVENQYRNPEGNPYYWDQVLLDAVRAEQNVQLFLNTDVREVEAVGPARARHLESVVGWTMGAERLTRYVSPIFIDCTGDGLVGDFVGADYRIGREGRAEYGEDWAPEEPDSELLGSTILFYTKDLGRPERFIAPSIAKDIASTPIPANRIITTGANGCAYWWIEYGGQIDTVLDNEDIRDELWSVIFGVWDYIKNSGKFDAETLTLEWVGAIPGKREYRRFLGDYVLTQQDVMNQRCFDDAVGFGGWSIDLHPVEGVYAKEPGSKHLYPAGVYEIPFRCLYSINVDNLLMAGRNISASHVAFGTTRVMATCAVVGEAAGTAAAICATEQCSPRELAAERLGRLRGALMRNDASLVGALDNDSDDLARSATVRASSSLSQLGQEPTAGSEKYPLRDGDVALLVPVEPRLDHLELLVDAVTDSILTAELWTPDKPQNYVPERLVAACEVAIGQGEGQWVKLPLSLTPELACNALVVLRQNAELGLVLADERPYGVLCLQRLLADQRPSSGPPQLLREWEVRQLRRHSLCFRTAPATIAYGPDKVVDGYHRPYGGPHLWCSRPGEAHWLELSWREPPIVSEIDLIFNDDVDEDLINLHHHRSPFEVVPELVRNYRIEVQTGDGQWRQVVSVSENRQRHRRHLLGEPVRAQAVRVLIDATHGDPAAQVVAVRIH